MHSGCSFPGKCSWNYFENESEIINHIISLNDITVFIIAHNVNALKNCDKIIYLDNGFLKDFDTFEKITEKYKII